MREAAEVSRESEMQHSSIPAFQHSSILTMASFSCPKFDFATDGCMKLGKPCVPCQPGCVLYGKAVMAEASPKARPHKARRKPASG